MRRAEYTISSINALRYIAAALVLVSVFFTLFIIEPYYSTDYMAHSILPQENSPDSVRLLFRYSEGITLSAVLLLIGETAFVVLCLSCFINKCPWLLALPMAVIALAHGLSIGALIELAVVAVFALTAAGIICTKLPTVLLNGIYAAMYAIMLISAGVGFGDELIAPLIWTALLLVSISMKKCSEA